VQIRPDDFDPRHQPVPQLALATAGADGHCVACAAAATEPWATIGEHEYVRCTGCGLVRLDPMPSAADAALFYDDTYFTASAHRGYADYLADERIHRRNARRHLRRLHGFGALPPGRLVEVGAAAGFLLDEARREGWRVAGTDVAPSMREAARARHDIELASAVGELTAEVDAGRIDLVDVAVANQVLEHLVDPLALLTELRSRMRPGALLSIETWDRGSRIARLFGRRWQQVNPPSVLWLWDASQLRHVVERAGFEVVRCRASVKLVSVATVAGQLGHVGPLRAVPLPYGLGDLVVLIGRVPDPRAGAGAADQVAARAS
jgi:SAM-dependent methyltransferase